MVNTIACDPTYPYTAYFLCLPPIYLCRSTSDLSATLLPRMSVMVVFSGMHSFRFLLEPKRLRRDGVARLVMGRLILRRIWSTTSNLFMRAGPMR